MTFKLKSGNTTSFKQMGSSPAKTTPPEGAFSKKKKWYVDNYEENKDKPGFQEAMDKEFGGETKMEGKTSITSKSTPAKQRVDPLDLGLLDEAKKVKVNKGLPKNFNTTGKDSWVKRSKEILNKSKKAAKKGLKKGGKFLGKRSTGVLGLLGGGSLNATATNPNIKKSEGQQIKNLLTKHKLKGGRK